MKQKKTERVTIIDKILKLNLFLLLIRDFFEEENKIIFL
jgi:hypothetical protein